MSDGGPYLSDVERRQVFASGGRFDGQDPTPPPPPSDPGPGCLSEFGNLGCGAKVVVVAVLAVGLIALAFNGDDLSQTPSTEPSQSDDVRWAGVYNCSDGDIGVRFTTRFEGEPTIAGVPISITIDYTETPVGPDGNKTIGDPLGQRTFSGFLADGVVTFESDGDPGSEPFAATAGRARITANGAEADTMSGRMRAPGCSTFEVTQLSD